MERWSRTSTRPFSTSIRAGPLIPWTGDPIVPSPKPVRVPRILGGEIEMLGYAPETTVAEKGVTILERGIASTRRPGARRARSSMRVCTHIAETELVVVPSASWRVVSTLSGA
ncbi:hypothetical protein DSY14_16775 [Nocardiopsis sp. MG754419]|nr:hypothetical protein [Nocardiopsis sp. MG754419]